VSGGALNPEKYYWYLAHFKWENGNCKLIEDTPKQVFIETENENKEPITYKNQTKPQKQ
jgi:hypothetical protein